MLIIIIIIYFIFHFKTYIQSVFIRLKPETAYVLDFRYLLFRVDDGIIRVFILGYILLLTSRPSFEDGLCVFCIPLRQLMGDCKIVTCICVVSHPMLQ